MAARFELDIFIVLRADLAELECRAHLAVDLVLLRRDLHVTFRRRLKRVAQVGVDGATVGVEVAEREKRKIRSDCQSASRKKYAHNFLIS